MNLLFSLSILITYLDLGHLFYPSSQWVTAFRGPIQQHVLADLYSWFESHSGFTPLYTSMHSSNSSLSTTLSINNIILNLKERGGKFNYHVALRGQNSFSILSDNLFPILTTIKHRK